MENTITLKQIQEVVDLAIGSQEYGRAYRAFKYALEEAHSVLTLEDINELISIADENYACTCETCDEESAKTEAVVN